MVRLAWSLAAGKVAEVAGRGYVGAEAAVPPDHRQPSSWAITSQPPAGVMSGQPPAGVITSEPPAGVITSQPPAGVVTGRPLAEVIAS